MDDSDRACELEEMWRQADLRRRKPEPKLDGHCLNCGSESEELTVTANAGKTLSASSEQESETACKPKKASRTLRFNKWVGYAAASVSGLVSLGDAFGYMKADWTCAFLLIAVVAISSYNYWLRLHTSKPVK